MEENEEEEEHINEFNEGTKGGEEEESSTNLCIICHQSDEESSLLCLVSHCQRSSVFEAKKRTPCIYVNTEEEKEEESEPIRSSSFFFLQSCGHLIHSNCFEIFFQRLVATSPAENYLFDPSKGQFQCPLCKTISNLLVPLSTLTNSSFSPSISSLDMGRFDNYLNDMLQMNDASREADGGRNSSTEKNEMTTTLQPVATTPSRSSFVRFLQSCGLNFLPSMENTSISSPSPPSSSNSLPLSGLLNREAYSAPSVSPSAQLKQSTHQFFLNFLFVTSKAASFSLGNALYLVLTTTVYTIHAESRIKAKVRTHNVTRCLLSLLKGALTDCEMFLQVKMNFSSTLAGKALTPSFPITNNSDPAEVFEAAFLTRKLPLLFCPLLEMMALSSTLIEDAAEIYHISTTLCVAALLQITLLTLKEDGSLNFSILVDEKMESTSSFDLDADLFHTLFALISCQISSAFVTERFDSKKDFIYHKWRQFVFSAESVLNHTCHLLASSSSLSQFLLNLKTPSTQALLSRLISKWLRAVPLHTTEYKLLPTPSLLLNPSPHLLSLPREYTQLHGHVLTLCSLDYPAICLTCGLILDASGKGACTAHIQSCCGAAGLVFLVQDCSILLLSGERCCYFPSPYVDSHGEKHKHFKGKPVYLDPRRFVLLHLYSILSFLNLLFLTTIFILLGMMPWKLSGGHTVSAKKY